MITKDQYVDRLEEMLKVEKPCATCPGLKGFADYTSQDHCGIEKAWISKGAHWLDMAICKRLCRPFVELPATAKCPCFTLGEAEALKCAHIAIEAYRSGVHRWCTEKE